MKQAFFVLPLILVLPFVVLAHTSLDEHEHADGFGAGGEPVVESVNSSGSDFVSEEAYQSALEQARLRGVQPTNESLSTELLKQSSDFLDKELTKLPPGAEQLPFPPLVIDVDRDRDGLSDFDEQRLGTNALASDSDGDTYIDGLEIVRGYNPLVKSPGDGVTYSLPPTNGQALLSPYKITGVRMTEREGQKLLVVSGVAPADSLVLLLSQDGELKHWFVRSDTSSRFLYVSSDTLSVGEHIIYAVAISVDGTPVEASEPFSFTRTENGVEVPPAENDQLGDVTKDLPDAIWWQQKPWVFIFGVLIMAPVIVLPVYLLLRRRALHRRE